MFVLLIHHLAKAVPAQLVGASWSPGYGENMLQYPVVQVAKLGFSKTMISSYLGYLNWDMMFTWTNKKWDT